MNTTLVKTHSATDGAAILRNTEARSTAIRPIVCYAMDADTIVISGCNADEAAAIIDGTDATIFETR